MVTPPKPSSAEKSPFHSLNRQTRHKPKWFKRYLSWLSLSLMSFLALMLVIVYESRWVYPEIQAYFSQTGNLTGQQLATRSREYLQDLQAVMLSGDISDVPETNASPMPIKLDLAYGLFDVSVYHEYACTQGSLRLLDNLSQAISAQQISNLEAARRLHRPIKCLTEIEKEQLDRRGEAINRFADSTRRHNQLVTSISLVIFLVGLLFWWMHERQLRKAEQATGETLAWIQRALHDPLTGVGNRSALNEDIAAFKGTSLGLILIDVDFFKQYNDTLGHPQGDSLLLELTALMANAFKVEARLYRLGGDEFAALLPCQSRTELEAFCDQLMSQVRRAALPHPSHPQHKSVTVSIGATRFCASQSAYSQIYQNADHALYDVKAAGRDSWRVVG